MRNKYFLGILFFIMAACNKQINERTVPDFEPTSVDNGGGNWKTLVLTSGC
jgi:hypothetical protein